MHPKVLQRMVMPFTLYKRIGMVDGDVQFAPPIEYKGYIVDKQGIVIQLGSINYQVKTIIYIDGSLNDYIHEEDEIEIPGRKRTTVRLVSRYASLKSGCELLEVYL